MSDIIKCKINVSKINKEKLFKGDKGAYLDCTLLASSDNQYGNDYMIVQDVSKEERLAGVKGAIIGNGKIFVKRSQPAPKSSNATPENEESSLIDSGIPF